MSHTDTLLVKEFYNAYARGDGEAAMALMASDIVWLEAEGHPFADRNPYVGPRQVLEGVFDRVAKTWAQRVEVEEVYPASDDRVIVSCRYRGRNIQTNKIIDVQVLHVWTVAGGNLVRFQQYADTAQIVGSTIP